MPVHTSTPARRAVNRSTSSTTRARRRPRRRLPGPWPPPRPGTASPPTSTGTAGGSTAATTSTASRAELHALGRPSRSRPPRPGAASPMPRGRSRRWARRRRGRAPPSRPPAADRPAGPPATMLVAGRRAEHDRAAAAAPAGEARAEAADDPHRDAARPVLDGDVDLPARPPRADAGERRGEHVEVHLRQLGPAASDDSTTPHAPRPSPASSRPRDDQPMAPAAAEPPTVGRHTLGGGLERVNIGPPDPPDGAVLGAGRRPRRTYRYTVM